MKGYVSSIISLLILIIAVFVVSISYESLMEMSRAEIQMSSETRMFVDKVIDTGRITDDMLADYNLALASYSTYYSAKIQRKVHVINPDPDNPGETYSAYMIVDDNRTFEQGDIVVVTVTPVGFNIFQLLASSLFGKGAFSEPFTYAGRVR